MYPLTCKVFLARYAGQTVNEFRLRLNGYESDDCKHQKLGSCMQHLFEYFNCDGYPCFL